MSVYVLNFGNCIPTLLQEERLKKTYNSFLYPVSFKMNIIWISVDWFHVFKTKICRKHVHKLSSGLLSNSDMATAIFCLWLFSLILRAALVNESWLEGEKYKPWLERDSNNKNSFRCKFCSSKISLLNMGKRSLESHMQGVRNKQKTPVKSGCIFKTVRKTTSDANVNTATSKVKNIPMLTMKNSEITTAEIYWALKVVQSNLSLNSCNDLNSLF